MSNIRYGLDYSNPTGVIVSNYKPKQINIPIAIFHGGKDTLSNMKNVFTNLGKQPFFLFKSY